MGASPSTSRAGTPQQEGITISFPTQQLPPLGAHSHTNRSNDSPPPLSNTAFPPLNTTPPDRGDGIGSERDIVGGGEHNRVYNPLTPKGAGSYDSGGALLSASPPVTVDGGHDSTKWGALRDRVLERRQRHNQLHPNKSSVSSSEPSRTRNPSTRSEGRSFNNNTSAHSITNGIQILEWSMTFGPTEECFNRMDAEGSTVLAAPPTLDVLTLVQQQERLAMGLKGLPKPGCRLRGSMFKPVTPRGPALGVHDAFKPLNIPEVQLAYRRLVRGVVGRGQRDGSRVTISPQHHQLNSQRHHQRPSFARSSSSSTAAQENPLSSFPHQSSTKRATDAHYHQQQHLHGSADQQVRRSRRRSSCDNPLVEVRRRSLSISSIASTSSPSLSTSSSSLSTSVSSVDTLDSLPEEKEVPQSKIGVSDLLLTNGDGNSSSGSWVAASAGEGGLDPQSTHMVGGEFTSADALNNKDTADFFANDTHDTTSEDGGFVRNVDSNSNITPPTNGVNRHTPINNNNNTTYSSRSDDGGGEGGGVGDHHPPTTSSSNHQGVSPRVSVVAFTHSNATATTPTPTTTTRFPVVSILDDGLPPRPPQSDSHYHKSSTATNDNSSSDHYLRACSNHASFGSSCSMQTPMSGASPPTAIKSAMKMSVSRTNSFPSGALSNSYMNKTNTGSSTQSDPQQQHHRGSSSFEGGGGGGRCYSPARTSLSTATSSAQQQCINNNNNSGMDSLMVVWPDIPPSSSAPTTHHHHTTTTIDEHHNASAQNDDDPLLIQVSCSSIIEGGVSPPPPLFRPSPPASRRPPGSSPPRFDANDTIIDTPPLS